MRKHSTRVAPVQAFAAGSREVRSAADKGGHSTRCALHEGSGQSPARCNKELSPAAVESAVATEQGRSAGNRQAVQRVRDCACRHPRMGCGVIPLFWSLNLFVRATALSFICSFKKHRDGAFEAETDGST